MTLHKTTRAVAMAVAAITITASLTGLAGCSQDPSQTSVVSGDAAAVKTELTPLQRGEVRTSALRTAKPAVASWEAMDPAAMAKTWTPRWVNYYKKLYADYAAQGKKRVRDFKVQSIDVVDMNQDGSQVLVDVWGYDRGYLVDSSGTKNADGDPNKLVQIQLTLNRDPKTKQWTVGNAIMANALLR